MRGLARVLSGRPGAREGTYICIGSGGRRSGFRLFSGERTSRGRAGRRQRARSADGCAARRRPVRRVPHEPDALRGPRHDGHRSAVAVAAHRRPRFHAAQHPSLAGGRQGEHDLRVPVRRGALSTDVAARRARRRVRSDLPPPAVLAVRDRRDPQLLPVDLGHPAPVRTGGVLPVGVAPDEQPRIGDRRLAARIARPHGDQDGAGVFGQFARRSRDRSVFRRGRPHSPVPF